MFKVLFDRRWGRGGPLPYPGGASTRLPGTPCSEDSGQAGGAPAEHRGGVCATRCPLLPEGGLHLNMQGATGDYRGNALKEGRKTNCYIKKNSYGDC